MNKIKLGFIGGGGNSLIGVVHRIASQMFDKYEIVGGVFNTDWNKNINFSKTLGLNQDRIYKDIDDLINNEMKLPQSQRMSTISILTPNFLHFPMAKKLIKKGFNIICEKPLTTSYKEALELESLNKEYKTVFGVTYTYTGYPMIRQMKQMIADGEIGKVQKIDMQYYQGWINPIIHDKKKRNEVWRLSPKKSGISCCIGDIGSHAFDMLEYVTDIKVLKILSDLNYMYDDNPLDIDGTILVRMNNGSKGVIRASQIATGEENNFTVAIYGEKGGLKWEQENPNYLHHLRDDKPYQIFKRGNDYNSKFAENGVKIPSGHPEGIFDAMGNIYNGVAKAINNEKSFKGEYPLLSDGVRGMLFIEKAITSNNEGNIWVEL